jgi:hypothetical protein
LKDETEKKTKKRRRRFGCWRVKLKKKSNKKRPIKINQVNTGQPVKPTTQVMRSR